ncbi:cyclin-D3-1-like isoform X1 [Typha latifolia]|uniref:cyclin-D3-1-like isoform X1 n=1 Tax=Typha latifolia TaxID=4733 RepID=UPI003C2C60D5
MGIEYGFGSSNLLCGEDNNSILCFDDEEEVGLHGKAESRSFDPITYGRNGFYRDFVMGFPLISEDCMDMLVERERQHLPRGGYAKRLQSGASEAPFRVNAIDWLWKVHCHHNFGPLSLYLSVNYLDRFLSAYELPRDKAWMTQLLSVACLSLAAKMEETEVPVPLDLQVCEAEYVFEAKTIRRMELLVLSTLNWRMQAVTPFSFIDYFLNKFNEGKPPTNALVSRLVELILGTIRGTEFLEFRPSEIAAAMALSALVETQFMDIDKALSCCIHVDKWLQESALRCYEMIQDMALVNKRSNNTASPSVLSVPQSPIGVLEAAHLSYRSDDTPVGSNANPHQIYPSSKRRKLSRPSIS